jgi:hypothetical protein
MKSRAESVAWLDAKRTAHNAQDVVYRRGTLSLTIAATPVRPVFLVVDDQTLILQAEARDFLVSAALVVVNGSPVPPAIGDRIEQTAAGIRYSFEVMPFGSEPAWRWSDTQYQTLRVHTKLVKREAV